MIYCLMDNPFMKMTNEGDLCGPPIECQFVCGV